MAHQRNLKQDLDHLDKALPLLNILITTIIENLSNKAKYLLRRLISSNNQISINKKRYYYDS